MSRTLDENIDEHPTIRTGEKRQRLPTRKGFQNTLLSRTAEFNKDAKLLQADILSVRAALSQGEMSTLKTATALMDNSKRTFERSIQNLESLFFRTDGTRALSGQLLETQVKST